MWLPGMNWGRIVSVFLLGLREPLKLALRKGIVLYG